MRSSPRTRTSSGRLPEGCRKYDELILALDLYLRHGQSGATDPEVVALSELLNRLPIHQDRPDAARFRNPNGVATKLGNFARVDPNYPGVGLARGGQREHIVWRRYVPHLDELDAAVERIRGSVEPGAPIEMAEPFDDEAESVEGRILFRLHRVRERDRALVKRKKDSAMKRHGRLACEACDIDSGQVYGPVGHDYIECHHDVPLSLGAERPTRLADLSLVCANCHRVLHRSVEPLAVAELRSIVQRQRRAE